MATFSRQIALLLLAAGALALPPGAWAQDACDTGTLHDRMRVRYDSANACWKKDAGIAGRVEAIEKAFTAAPGSIEAARDLVQEESRRLPAADGQPDAAPYIANLRKLVGDATRDLRQLPSVAALNQEGGSKYRALLLDSWDAFDGPNSYGEHYLEDQECDSKTKGDARCDPVFAKAVQIGDAMFLVHNVLDFLRRKPRADLEKQLEARKAKWHSYLYDSQFQYWWELGLNHYLERECPRVLPPHRAVHRVLAQGTACPADNRDEAGNETEWREPPNLRAIALHPEVGFMYKRDEPDGDRIKPSLVFQWFGYQWWEYKGNKVSDLRGLSLVSTVSDNVEGNAVGLGLQVQYEEYALALTSHGGKPVLTFSFALVDRASKLSDEWADRLKRLKQD